MENIRFKENKFSYFSNGIYTNWLIVKQFRPRPLVLVRNERMNIQTSREAYGKKHSEVKVGRCWSLKKKNSDLITIFSDSKAVYNSLTFLSLRLVN